MKLDISTNEYRLIKRALWYTKQEVWQNYQDAGWCEEWEKKEIRHLEKLYEKLKNMEEIK